MKVQVVGGSLVGTTVALLLKQVGCEVEVFEATPKAVNRAGGVIGLEHPSLEVLDRLGICQSEIVPFTGEQVVKTHLTDRRPRNCESSVYPGRNTTWTLLQRALESRLQEDVVRRGARVRATDGRFTVDDEELDADLVVFADGRTSIGRKVLDPHRMLKYAGYVAHRGERDGCPTALCGAVNFSVADSAMLATFPVASAIDWTFYSNASRADYERWFGASPEKRPFALPHHVGDEARRFVDDEARSCMPDPQVELVCGTERRAAAAIMDIDPPTRAVWPLKSGGLGVLVGDALAPVRPHTAKGLNNGISQASDLAGVLRQHLVWHASLNSGLAGWESRHVPWVAGDVARGPELGRRVGLGF